MNHILSAVPAGCSFSFVGGEMMESAAHLVRPDVFDVLVSDVGEEDLRGVVSSALGVDYLSESTMPATWPVEGVLVGPHKRVFVNLSVQLKEHAPRNVFFLVRDVDAVYCNLLLRPRICPENYDCRHRSTLEHLPRTCPRRRWRAAASRMLVVNTMLRCG